VADSPLLERVAPGSSVLQVTAVLPEVVMEAPKDRGLPMYAVAWDGLMAIIETGLTVTCTLRVAPPKGLLTLRV
jgi:hypothetical protein